MVILLYIRKVPDFYYATAPLWHARGGHHAPPTHAPTQPAVATKQWHARFDSIDSSKLRPARPRITADHSEC